MIASFARAISLVILATAFPAVTPVYALDFRGSWICLSIDYGAPIRGMVRDPVNGSRFDYSGQGTSWNDGSGSLTIGWTPFMVSPTIGLGFSIRGSAALSLGDNGEVDRYSDPIPLTNYRYNEGNLGFIYLGTWASVSPMLTARLLLRSDVYVNIGAGPTFWKYLSMDYKGMEYDDDLLDDAVYASFAAMAQVSIGWFYAELGVSGPDFQIGLGFSI